MNEAHNHKRVTPEGRALGEQMARMVEKPIARLIEIGEPDERCKSCAFRPGTVPNGCLQTQADAMKAVVENVPFLCHQSDPPREICHGWFAARISLLVAEVVKGPMPVTACPWEFSDEAKA